MTDVINGRIFFIAMRKIEVPRHFDARLYSLSRMITTCVRIKYAMASHPVTVSANTMVQKLGEKISTRTEIRSTYGIFPMML